MKTVTRRQLRDLGANGYQATLMTKDVSPICQQGRTNVYSLFSVSDRIRNLLENNRIRIATRDALQAIRWELLALAGQIQDAPFGMTVFEQIEEAEMLNQQAEELFAQAKARAEQLREART